MSERTSSKPGIADYVVARRKRKECFLDEIDRLIDWNPLEKLLRKTLKRVVNAVGNSAYPPLPMFKILLLQRWYNLSDAAVEEALYDRLTGVAWKRGLSTAETAPAGQSLDGRAPPGRGRAGERIAARRAIRYLAGLQRPGAVRCGAARHGASQGGLGGT